MRRSRELPIFKTRRIRTRVAQIPRELAEEVLRRPQQIVPERPPKKAYQSKLDFGGSTFLLRVIVDDTVEPAMVVTLYRTSKIDKYWSQP